MKKLALHWQIIIGLILGLVYGLIAANAGWLEFTSDWIAPWGKIFINMLKMIAVPLVLISLINGISGLKDISQLSSMGGKTIGIYLFTTVLAVTIGLLAVNIVQPGKSFSEETRKPFFLLENGIHMFVESLFDNGGVMIIFFTKIDLLFEHFNSPRHFEIRIYFLKSSDSILSCKSHDN